MLILSVLQIGVSGFKVNLNVVGGIFENIVNVNIVGYKCSFVYMIIIIVFGGNNFNNGVFFVVVE